MNPIAIILLSFAVSAFAEDLDLAKIFNQNNITGTIVISSLDGKTNYVHNDKRSQTRFLPASTFKIPNSLIALEASIVKSDSEIKWDSIQREITACNNNQTLQTAFRSSCVWVYQNIAKKIGANKYQLYLDKMNYGNKTIGVNVATFWLEGNFAISAVEQISFLRSLVTENLPFSQKNIQTVKAIMVNDSTDSYIIRAKTGYATSVNPNHGWFVGYVDNKSEIWLFATNIDIKSSQELSLRKEITINSLKEKKIIK